MLMCIYTYIYNSRMMRKTILFALAALVGLSACSQKSEKQREEPKEAKTLVAYFSASGVTRGVAQQLAEVAGADLHEIAPAEVYTEADLDWRDSLSRSSVEMKDKSSRPALAETDLKLEDYNVIYVGYPIWWGTCPTIINTFLEAYYLTGKTIIPFATSGGSGIEQSQKDLSEAYPQATWKQGKLLNSPTREALEAFVKTTE